MNILGMYTMESFHLLNFKFMNNFKNFLNNFSFFIKEFYNLYKKKIILETLNKVLVKYSNKLKNLTPEEKIELFAELRFRIIYHGVTFLIAYIIASAIIDYLDQYF